MPNNPLMVAAVQALCAGGSDALQLDGGWRKNRSGEPVFEFWSGSGARIFVRIDAEPEAAWRDVRAYSALTLDTALSLLVCLAGDSFRAQTCAPRRAAVRLGAPAVLAAKGYKRFGAEREAFAATVESDIARVLRLRFDIRDYPGFDVATRKWNGAGLSRDGVCLVEAVEAEGDDTDGCSRCQPLRFGAWAEMWLNAGGAMWVSPLPRALLWLDHRDNRGPDALAKKVGVLLALNWGAARKNKDVRVGIRTLLRRIGELPRPGAGAIPQGGRLADRMEEALLRLSEANLLPNMLAANDAASLRAESRRWFDTWLEADVTFLRPAFLNRPNVL